MDGGRGADIDVDLPVDGMPKRGIGRGRRTIHWAMVGFYSAMLLLFGGFSTWDDYRSSLREAELNTANYARLLEEHAKRTLEATDLLVQRLQDHIAVRGMKGFVNSGAEWQTLSTAAVASPQTGALLVLDPVGNLLFSTRQFPVERGINFADQDFFRAVVAGAPSPYVGMSFFELGTGIPSFAVARRIDGPDGSLAGVAVATIEANYFKAFYGHLGFSEHVAFGIYKHDGTILARQPMVMEDVGRKIPANAPMLQSMVTQPAGIFRAVSTYDYYNRIVAYRQVDDPAIVVWVGTTEEDALVEWRLRLVRNVALALASFVVMGGLSLLVLRGIRREEKAAKALSALFDLSPLGMIRSDTEGRILAANRAFLAMLGYGPQQVSALTHRDISRPGAAEEDGRQWRILLEEGRYGPYEKEFVRADGSRVPVRLNGVLVQDPEAAYSWTIVEDITERLEAENALRRKTEELARSNAELEQFAYVASHDLREPLRMVSSYVTLLERRFGDVLGKDGKDFVGFAKEGAVRMNKLILNLLEFSRIGRDPAPAGIVQLGSAVEVAIDYMGVAIAETGAVVTVETEMPVVRGDAEELTRLFENLIGNAMKYRKPDLLPEIRIRAVPEGEGWWRISVADNGIGIDPQYHQRIFNIFQRLHGREKYEGTGIGLALCKKVIENAGGHIWVDSREGDGATFHFTLPAAADPETRSA